MKTSRAVKRVVPDSDIRVAIRFQSLRASNLLPAAGTRVHQFAEGFKELVEGERAHGGVKAEEGAKTCQPHVAIFGESLFFHPEMEARTKTDFVHGPDPVWEPHDTPVLHTRLNHLESLGSEVHNPRGVDQPDIVTYSSIILKVRDSLGGGRTPGIGTATIAVRDPSSEVVSVVPHTNCRHIFRAFDAPLYQNGVDTGGRISGVLELYDRAVMENLTSFSIVKNMRQLLTCILTLMLCSCVYTLQDYVWKSLITDSEHNPLLIHTLGFTLAACVGFAGGGFLLDRIGRKLTLILGWMVGFATTVPQYLLITEPNIWLLLASSICLGLQYGLCTISSLLTLIDRKSVV
jgi:hypothetical protein